MRIVQIPFTPERITASERDKIEASNKGKGSLDVPTRSPAYEDIVGDDKGRLWFKLRFRPQDEMTRFWVVDPVLLTTAEANASGDVTIWAVVRGHAYGIRTDQAGRRTVVRYAVE